jgi:ActR/RegA family two-component response regulator
MVLLLEDDADLREVLEEALPMLGLGNVFACANVPELQGASERALACDGAIIDVNLGPGQPTGLDAASWLRSKGFTGRIVFLTGHASSYPALVQLCRLPGNALAKKPVELASLTALLQDGLSC